jgi:preprotein translocase subunit Sec63
MRWYGKFFGALAGWALAKHPGGAAIGMIVGHAFDADWLRPKKYDPYAVLGLRDDASEGEIDRAYRRLIAQYHPDRLVGVAEDLRLQAEDKAREINTAYDRIQKLRARP